MRSGFPSLGDDPFQGDNPFLRLRASPSTPISELADRARVAALYACSEKEEREVRGALWELTRDAAVRAAWAVLSSPTGEPAPEATNDALRAGDLLGRILLGGEAPAETTQPYLARFAVHLGWDRRITNEAEAAALRSAGDRWWQVATHIDGGSGEWWHHLAVVYLGEALSREAAEEEREARCAEGEPPDDESDRLLDACWLRAFRCWALAVGDSEFRPRLGVFLEAESPGDGGGAVVEFESGFIRYLVGLVVDRAERAALEGNRLTVARLGRLLRILEDHPDLELFREVGSAGRAELLDRLWVAVSERETRCRERFQRVFDGPLLLEPEDPKALKTAFEAMIVTVNEEGAEEKEPEDGVAMCRCLSGYVDPVARRVFDEGSGAGSVRKTADEGEIQNLHAFHLVLARCGSAVEQAAHEPLWEVLEQHVKGGM